MTEIQTLLSSLVDFYRLYADKNIGFEKLSDLEFKIDLGTQSANAISNLNTLSLEHSGLLLVEQIKLDGQNKKIEKDSDFHEYMGTEITFKLEDVDFGGVFEYSLENFLKYTNLAKEPDSYFIADIDYLNDENRANDKIDNYKRVLRLIPFLSEICDHSQVHQTDGTLNLHILGKTKVDFVTAYNVEDLSSDLSDVDSLVQEIQTDPESSHYIEKKKIFRKCLIDTLSNRPNAFSYLLMHFKRVSKLYLNNYDLYLHEFSFDKFIDDVSKEKLEFVTSINSTISTIGLRFASLPLIALVGKFFSSTLIEDRLAIQVSATLYGLLLGIFLYFNLDTVKEISRAVKNTFSEERIKQENFIQGDMMKEITDVYSDLSTRICVIWCLIWAFYIAIAVLLAYVWLYL